MKLLHISTFGWKIKGSWALVCLLLLAFRPDTVTDRERAVTDFVKVNETYKQENLSMDIVYRMFDTYTGTEPAMQMKGYFHKREGAIHSVLMGIETLQNDQYKIVMDNTNKTMLLTAPDSLSKKSTSGVNIQQALTVCTTVQYLEKEQEKIYKLFFKKGFEYNEMDIHIAGKSFFIRQLDLFFEAPVNLKGEKEGPKAKPRAEISYSNVKKKPGGKPADFYTATYMTLQNKQPAPSKKYAGYKFLNQTINVSLK